MKRIFTLLVAVLFVSSAALAQIATVRTIKDAGARYSKPTTKLNTVNNSKAQGGFWFNLVEGVANAYFGESGTDELDYWTPVSVANLNAYFQFDDTTMNSQIFSSGQIYDWAHSGWNDYYYGQEMYADYNIPYLADANYSIDSTCIVYYYSRGTNVPEDVVDTLFFAYVLNMDEEPVHTLSTSAGEAFKMLYVPFDYTIMNTAYASPDSNPTLGSDVVIVYDTVLFTYEDTTEGTSMYYLRVPTPDALHNVKCNRMAVTYTFVPGNTTEGIAYIDEDYNKFGSLLYSDPRADYAYPWGTSTLMNDVQWGLFADNGTCDPEDGWFGVYCANTYDDAGNEKPELNLYISCNDCSLVGVEEEAAETISVYPNPATTTLHVDLAGDAQATIQLFNLVGQQVYSETATNSTVINTSNLHTGVYMLKVSQNGKVYTSKVVVK